MPRLTLAEAAGWAGGRLTGDRTATALRVVADSRTVAAGDAFAAIGRGRAFAAEALAKGAPFAIVDRAEALPSGRNGLVVDDIERALAAIAAGVRARLGALRVLGITGSTGKTLTKDLIRAVTATRYRVHATPKSYNAEIGVPLTVLGCPDDAEVLVCELAARAPGQIAELCDIVRPDIGVLTGVGSTHLELFGTREAIVRTKAELLESLPAGGASIVASNDDFLQVFSDATSARTITVGPGGAVRYRATGIDAGGRTHGHVAVGSSWSEVVLPVPGRPLMRNAAMAIAAGAELGIETDDAARAIESAALSAWRMEITRIGDWTIVNDAYNSNPTSADSALRSVRELASGRETWAVLGEMAELGPVSRNAHENVGRLAAALGYAGVIVVGGGAAWIANGAGPIARRTDSFEETIGVMHGAIPAGAVVLMKASRSIGFERLIDALRSDRAELGA